MRLEPTAGGSRYTIEGDVKVAVPLIGGKAERFIAEMVTKLAAKGARAPASRPSDPPSSRADLRRECRRGGS
jgi:hypothetical protein